MTALATSKTRLLHIDWMRGLAVVIMIQTHTIDSWLVPALKGGWLFRYSQLLGSFPAPCFLFLAGLSAALGYGKVDRDVRPAPVKLWLSARRGLEILGLALLFRLQEFVQWTSWSGWRDFFKVDILNTIGVSLMLLGLLFFAVRRDAARLALLAALTIAVSLATPAVWSWPWLGKMPWALKNYLIGTFTSGHFPLFPWFGFAPAGAIVGLSIKKWKGDQRMMAPMSAGLIVSGICLILISIGILHSVPHAANWSFWHNSPEYFFIRTGILLATLGLCYFLCLPFNSERFSFMRLFGRHSLLVYWVHIDLVYGRLLGTLKGTMGPAGALAGTIVLTAAMLLLARVVENWRSIWTRSIAHFQPPA
jgi:uncharacterized membrane protein